MKANVEGFKKAEARGPRDHVRRERGRVRRDCERRMECSPKAALCEKRQGYGCHEGPCVRIARMRKLAIGGRVQGELPRGGREWEDGEGNAGKDCKKAKAATRSAKAAVCGKSGRCQKRPCVRGLQKKTYTAKSGRIRGDCEKPMLLNGGREKQPAGGDQL